MDRRKFMQVGTAAAVSASTLARGDANTGSRKPNLEPQSTVKTAHRRHDV
ncbi:MAG: hypothetical protein RIK87_30390 [Fuerstiella sp.]